MKFLQKLVRNGGATQVTIPRPILGQLDFVAGQTVMVEVIEDGAIRVRRPREADFGPQLCSPRLSVANGQVKL